MRYRDTRIPLKKGELQTKEDRHEQVKLLFTDEAKLAKRKVTDTQEHEKPKVFIADQHGNKTTNSQTEIEVETEGHR